MIYVNSLSGHSVFQQLIQGSYFYPLPITEHLGSPLSLFWPGSASNSGHQFKFRCGQQLFDLDWSSACLQLFHMDAGTIPSRDRGSVTNNNGLWIGWLDLLALLLQLQLIITAHNQWLPKTRSILSGLRVSPLLPWLTWFWFTNRSLLQLPLSAD
jgi:hypothetical protein